MFVIENFSVTYNGLKLLWPGNAKQHAREVGFSVPSDFVLFHVFSSVPCVCAC